MIGDIRCQECGSPRVVSYPCAFCAETRGWNLAVQKAADQVYDDLMACELPHTAIAMKRAVETLARK